ncbi:hypothetical protein ACQVF9_21320, partial [Escherichia coli]
AMTVNAPIHSQIMPVFNLLLFKEIKFCTTGKTMSSTLVTMTCDDSIYRCQSTSGYFFPTSRSGGIKK